MPLPNMMLLDTPALPHQFTKPFDSPPVLWQGVANFLNTAEGEYHAQRGMGHETSVPALFDPFL